MLPGRGFPPRFFSFSFFFATGKFAKRLSGWVLIFLLSLFFFLLLPLSIQFKKGGGGEIASLLLSQLIHLTKGVVSSLGLCDREPLVVFG